MTSILKVIQSIGEAEPDAADRAAALAAQLQVLRDSQVDLIQIVCWALGVALTITLAVIFYQFYSASVLLARERASLRAELEVEFVRRFEKTRDELRESARSLQSEGAKAAEKHQRELDARLAGFQKSTARALDQLRFNLSEFGVELERRTATGPFVQFTHALACLNAATNLGTDVGIATALGHVRDALMRLQEPHWSAVNELYVIELEKELERVPASQQPLKDEVRELLRKQRSTRGQNSGGV